MNINEVTFDNFLELDKKDQEKIFNDFNLLKELVKKNNISEHRYTHSLSVAETAKMLASYHNVDPNKAYLAGLLHDVCKFKDSDESQDLEKILKNYEPSKLNGMYPVYHSWCAYYYLKEKTNFADEEVLRAIYNHTILTSKDPLSLIIYIADKREPLRNIDDNILEVAKNDLLKAYDMLEENVKSYVLLKKMYKAVDSKLAEDIKIIDIRNVNPYVDYFIICSANNERKANSIIDEVFDKCDELGIDYHRSNNYKNSLWKVADIGSIVCHVFVGSEREKYNLEGLWKDQPLIKM